jgi:hypothetical protein
VLDAVAAAAYPGPFAERRAEEVSMGFAPDAVVHVSQVDDKNWRLERELVYRGQRDGFVAPVGMGTDFASVPRVFVWLLPRYGRYTKAAIIHDYLWRTRVGEGDVTWKDADGLFRRAMRELGVPFLRRWMMWSAVRWAALFKRGGVRGWWTESPRVVLVSLVVTPIVLPPAALILLALGIFYVLEFVLWVPLKIGELVVRRRPAAPTPKQVNMPELELKT